MKKLTKPVLFTALITFLAGVFFSVIAAFMGGNVFRASANIDRFMSDSNIIQFEFATPEPTAVPYTDPFDAFFGDSDDIFDIFEQFGMGDDFISPYGGYYDTNPGNSGKIY